MTMTRSSKYSITLLTATLLATDTMALSSLAGMPNRGRSMATPPSQTPSSPRAGTTSSTDSTATTTSNTKEEEEREPWRIVLDIGREPLARMPFDWARSGARLPLVVPCDFVRQTTTTTTTLTLRTGNEPAASADQTYQQWVAPRSDTISFTGPDGAVVKPVEGGAWTLTSNNNHNNNPGTLQFSLHFPDALAKRDVSIDAGATLLLTAPTYTQQQLDQLNDAYYRAREATWAVGGALNQANQDAGKKRWNDTTQQWERAQPATNLWNRAAQQAQYWARKQAQEQALRQRPDANELSSRGTLPGMEPRQDKAINDENKNDSSVMGTSVSRTGDGIYIAQGGVIRLQDPQTGQPGPVMGTWSAQPIPKYYN